MNQRKQQMEDNIFNEQGIIWAKSDVFWTMQLTRDILANNEQYIQETLT